MLAYHIAVGVCQAVDCRYAQPEGEHKGERGLAGDFWWSRDLFHAEPTPCHPQVDHMMYAATWAALFVTLGFMARHAVFFPRKYNKIIDNRGAWKAMSTRE